MSSSRLAAEKSLLYTNSRPVDVYTLVRSGQCSLIADRPHTSKAADPAAGESRTTNGSTPSSPEVEAHAASAR